MPALFWLPIRLYIGITKPRRGIFGQEVAGVVEGAGNEVNRFKKGDAVFAPTMMRFGRYAQFVSLPEGSLTKFASDKMSFAAATTIPTVELMGCTHYKGKY